MQLQSCKFSTIAPLAQHWIDWGVIIITIWFECCWFVLLSFGQESVKQVGEEEHREVGDSFDSLGGKETIRSKIKDQES